MHDQMQEGNPLERITSYTLDAQVTRHAVALNMHNLASN